MYFVIQRVLREIALALVFFLPRDRKKRIERWLRGREDALKLAQNFSQCGGALFEGYEAMVKKI